MIKALKIIKNIFNRDSKNKDKNLERSIIASLRNHPDKWRISKFYLKHENAHMWIANGASYLKIEWPYVYEFSSRTKKEIWKAVEEFKRTKTIKGLRTNKNE